MKYKKIIVAGQTLISYIVCTVNWEYRDAVQDGGGKKEEGKCI